MKLYVGLDLGTSSLKMLLVDEKGKILRTVTEDYTVSYPAPGWSEQDPACWWNALLSGMPKLLADCDRSAVVGIGIGGQMHGLVVLDKNDCVIRPVILWNDGRCAKETAYLNEVVGKEKLARYTGNMAFAGFTAPKLLWMRDHEPENFAAIEKIMLPKDYLNYRLTGAHTSDFSDAAGTLMLDVEHKCWSAEMLSLCGVREECMPALYESSAIIGHLTSAAAEELGLATDVAVVAGAGDNAAAAVGTGTLREGSCNISLGTSGTVFVPSQKFVPLSNNSIHYFCHANGAYHLMGCILSAASCHKWFCEEILQTQEFIKEQKAVLPDDLGKNHTYFLPYLMGERSPINDTDARGAFIGMRADTARKDMLLAVLEGVAFAIRQNVDIIKNVGVVIEKSTVCGGGARSKLWLAILANVLGIPLELPVTEEGPGYGAAMLAMVGTGAYESAEACAEAICSVRETVLPDPVITARYAEKYENFLRIYPALREVFGTL